MIYAKNVFKANADSFHFFVSPFSNGTSNISGYTIESSHSEELLGIIIASYLTFKEHGKWLCYVINHKLHTLFKVVKYTSLKQRRIIMKAFIFS